MRRSSLIEKCAGLLARKEIGDELHLAFEELDRAGVAAAQHSLALLETLVRPDPHVVALHDRARGEQPLQQVGEQVPPGVGGLDQRLQRHAVCIAIDDQPGQQIRLAVDQPCSAPALGIRADDFAKRDRLRQAAEEELLVDGLVLPREQADGDLARRSVERLACEPAALVGEPHHFAATQRRGGGDIRAVDPDVSLRESIHGALREHDGRLIGRPRSDAPENGRRALHSPRRRRTWPDVAHRAGSLLEALEAARFLR